MTEIIYIVFGAAAGFAAAWFLSKSKYDKGDQIIDIESLKSNIVDLNSELKIRDEKVNFMNEQLVTYREQIQNKETELLNVQRNLAGKESDLKHLNERLLEHKNEVAELQAKFKLEFENLATKILEEKSGKFTEQNRKNLDEILNPLKEKIQQFERKVDETHKKDIEDRASIQERIKNLIETSNQISEDAKNLTKALKGDSKTQGNWGELILENILERSGLVKDREYFVQQSFKDETGSRFQPDVIVKYPGDRSVVVDSKVSLTAYEKFVAEENTDEQERRLNEHLISIKNHIKELSEKNYQDLYQLKTLDFVMMFIPIEPSYLVAIQKDPDLWNYAYERRILLISPTNLIAALKMIASMWRQEYQSQNVMEIARQSGALYDKFVGFVNDLQDIGNKLDSTKKAYDAALNKISTGKGNLITTAQKIKDLGAKTKKELPKELFED